MSAGKVIASVAVFLCLTFCCAAGSKAGGSGLPMQLHTSADLIEVTPRYDGELVKVWGTVPPDCEVIVQLTSPQEKAVFSRKGKVGPFWLSVGRVRFTNVPWMFKVKSSAPIDEIMYPDEQVRHQLGERGLKASIGVQKGVDRDLYLNELIMTRKAARLFSFAERGVKCKQGSFQTSFFWPSDGPPGRYVIEGYAVKAGQIVASRSRAIVVEKVGMEAWVSRLAKQNGILYGAFAVALAIVMGLAMNLAFKRSRGEIAKS